MLTVDFILTNAAILTMDTGGAIYDPGALAVTGDSIVAVGPAGDIAKAYTAAQTMDFSGRIIIPGMVNAHTHAPMTLLRGLADDLRLDVWLLGYMMPVEREFVSPDFCRLGTQLACAEMIRSGITSFADMYYFEDDVAKATAEAGMRAVCSQTVLKFPTPDAGSYEESLAYARDFIQRWKGHPLIVPSVAPHAPYTCTPEILQATAALAAEFDVPLHTHLAETALEVSDSRKMYGMPVIPWVKKQNLFEAKVLAAHCVHIDEGEIRTLRNVNAGVAHNPSSNLKLASGAAPVAKMLELGLNVGIGTDGPASNNDLDMFEETRLAAFLAKGISGDPTVLPAKQALEMATRLGAAALHIGGITGSLEPGKRADLAVVNQNTLHGSPRFTHDPNALYSQLVYTAHANDVTDVMANGKWLMRDRKLLTLDEEALITAASEYARRIDTFLIHREQSVLSKLIAIGGVKQEESFEVQVKARIQDPQQVHAGLASESITIIREAHYHEYDNYFSFADPERNRVRYREDEFIDDKGEVTQVRTRLTLIGESKEREFQNSVLLSRSRFIAPAAHSLRFYREYFRPLAEREVEKDRLRWLVVYRGVEFFVNLDRLVAPSAPGYFIEIKSRTWSQRDAEDKARLIGELMGVFGAKPDESLAQDYAEIAAE
ncbi:MAG: amidohydrolase family protein [Chloroflexi bacterium]|nr:amidohydrolase family protein [Chloroflexota bacterium]MBI2975465.1 amidohydrolase family protein [Chloroflexota bacterium]